MKKKIVLILICAICAFSVVFGLSVSNKYIADEQPPIIHNIKG